MTRKEFATALQMLHAALEHWPHEAMLLRMRSYVLLQEGRDWAAAEQALRALLEVEPHDQEARNNLALLLEMQGQPG